MKRKLKWILGIIAGIFVILIIGNIFTEGIVESKLKNKVKTASHGVYRLYFEEFDVNLLTASITASGALLAYDSVRLHELPPDEMPGTDLFELFVPTLSIGNLNLFAFFFRDQLKINTLSIDKPRVTMVSHPQLKAAVDTSATQNLHAMIAPALEAVEIEKITINGGAFQRAVHQGEKKISLQVRDIALFMHNFRVDASARKGKRLFYTDALALTLKNCAFKLPDSLYVIKVKEIGVSLADQKVYADSIQYLPLYGKYEFGRVKGHETDRVTLYNRHLEFSQVDFEAFLGNRQLKAAYLEIDGMNIHAFRDKRLPFPENSDPALPQEMLHNLDVYLKIDSINLRNSRVTYEEKIPQTERAGHISFVNLNALIYNVTNDKGVAGKGVSMKTYATAQLMGEGTLRATIDMPLASKNNAHTFKGTLSPMPLKAINPMLKYQAFAEIESGYNNALTFSAMANDNMAQGSMHFVYKDLKINLLKKNGNGKKDILSLIAGLFISSDTQETYTADELTEMYFERDQRKFIFNFWWKTLLSGFKSALKGKDPKEKS